MAMVKLTPDLERFAAKAVENGRYRDVSDVVRAGVILLRLFEAEQAAFKVSLEVTEAESEWNGFGMPHEVDRMIDDLIEASELVVPRFTDSL